MNGENSMPELPEVLTITTDLRKEILNKKITSVKTSSGYSLSPNEEFFSENIIGHTISEVSNIAKLIKIKFSSGKYIVIHLNMTGLLLYNKKDPYIKVSFEMDDKSTLYFSDVRMFGFLAGWNEEQVLIYKSKYGKTPLDDTLTVSEFIERISSKKSPIKNILLDQSVISGIGNIYANDSLFMSGIHPRSLGHKIPTAAMVKLFENLKIILQEGIQHRGSTIDRYRDIYGKPGTQQDYFRIYGKAGQKCTICEEIILSEKIQGRGTFFCPKCQTMNGEQTLI